MLSAPGAMLRSALETLLARRTKRWRRNQSKVIQFFSRSRGVGGEKNGWGSLGTISRRVIGVYMKVS